MTASASIEGSQEEGNQQLYQGLGEAVRARRKAIGISQEELAKRSGIDRAFISNIEKGARKPSVGTIYNIARGLKIRLSTLFSQCEKRIAEIKLPAEESDSTIS